MIDTKRLSDTEIQINIKSCFFLLSLSKVNTQRLVYTNSLLMQ